MARERALDRERALLLALVLLLAGCTAIPSPTPSAQPSAEPSATAEPTSTPEPSASGIPRLTLPAPKATASIAINYTATVEVEAGKSGRLVLVVTNLTQQMVPELVLRWPTAVRDTIFLAPFQPSRQRIIGSNR